MGARVVAGSCASTGIQCAPDSGRASSGGSRTALRRRDSRVFRNWGRRVAPVRGGASRHGTGRAYGEPVSWVAVTKRPQAHRDAGVVGANAAMAGDLVTRSLRSGASFSHAG